MYESERERVDRTIGMKMQGDRAGSGMYWDPVSKRIRYASNRDPDRSSLEATQSDMGHA